MKVGMIGTSCARALSRNLPKYTGKPKELDVFAIPAVVKKSERYVAQSLPGYDFLRRGLIADALLDNEQVRVFVMSEKTRAAARKTFDHYRTSLKSSGSNPRVTEGNGRISLEARDPLYGTVFVEQAGRFVIGAVRTKDVPAAMQLVEQLRTRVGEE